MSDTPYWPVSKVETARTACSSLITASQIRTIAVAIRAGENAGRTLPHRNIVRELVSLGNWRGKPIRIALPAAKPGLAGALLLQQGKGGPILAARKL